MIYLTKGQKLFGNEGMVVYDQTGYYEDDAPIVCAMVFAPEDSVCRYEAKFVAYGDTVYSITDADVLMEQVNVIDPNSLFGKTKDDVAVDQMVSDIEMVDNIEKIKPATSNSVVPVNDPTVVDESTPLTIPVVDPSTSTTTPIIDLVVPETATTTPPVISDAATTTAPVIIDMGITTPTMLEESLNASSTASEVVALVKKRAYKKFKLL